MISFFNSCARKCYDSLPALSEGCVVAIHKSLFIPIFISPLLTTTNNKLGDGIKEAIINKCCLFILGSNHSYDSDGFSTPEFSNCFVNANQMFLDHDYKVFIAGSLLIGAYYVNNERKLDRIRQVLPGQLYSLRLALLDGRVMLGNSMFLEQVRLGNIRAVRAYLDAGMSPNTSTWSRGRSALMTASMSANFSSMVIVLINAGANVNQRDRSGKTALMHASGMGRALTVRYLLKAGACVDQTDNYGYNALMHARMSAFSGAHETVEEITKVMGRPFVAERFLYGAAREMTNIIQSYL